ncbi:MULTISPECIES: RipA family octameric membrane protein [unclassified Nocardioides]|uniref:RipA family octameric membrane protein n=1 Tax=unclassified Nocardioides TaxID=2615069 RepID=UPI003014F019
MINTASDGAVEASQVLDLYKMAVEMADRVSARRSTANTFYLGLQTAGLAILGFVTSLPTEPSRGIVIAICLVGAATGVTWFLQLRSYRDLNRAKFDVINNLEKRLPVAVFSAEWESLKQDPVSRWRPRYAELGTIERVVPWFFVAMNLILAVYLSNQ